MAVGVSDTPMLALLRQMTSEKRRKKWAHHCGHSNVATTLRGSVAVPAPVVMFAQRHTLLTPLRCMHQRRMLYTVSIAK